MKRFFSIARAVLLSLLLLLTLAGAVGWGVLRRLERQRLYHPVADVTADPSRVRLRWQTVDFVTSDGVELTGWWIPADSPVGTVVFCHGNTGNIGWLTGLAPEFVRRRLNLLLWDYRGFGQSRGKPSEKGLYEDARSAYDAAAAIGKGVPVLVYGHSLGAAVALQLAHDRPVAGVMIEGGFASAADMARRLYPILPLDRLLSVSYSSAEKAATLPGCPKLIGHSPQDQVVPFQSGRLLHAAAARPKTFVMLSGGHSDHSWLTAGGAGQAEFDAFVRSALEAAK